MKMAMEAVSMNVSVISGFRQGVCEILDILLMLRYVDG